MKLFIFILQLIILLLPLTFQKISGIIKKDLKVNNSTKVNKTSTNTRLTFSGLKELYKNFNQFESVMENMTIELNSLEQISIDISNKYANNTYAMKLAVKFILNKASERYKQDEI